MDAGKILIGLIGLAYVLSPVDALPDFIPALGWVDDAAVGIFSVAQILEGLGYEETAEEVKS